MTGQNCLYLRMPTRFSSAWMLINDAYKGLPFGSENWAYPYDYYGNPKGPFYAEIFTEGMDWTLDFWMVHQTGYADPRAVLLAHFPDNTQTINSCDMRALLEEFCKAFNGEDVSHDVLCWLKRDEENINESVPGFTPVVYGHASQVLRNFYLNSVIADAILKPVSRIVDPLSPVQEMRGSGIISQVSKEQKEEKERYNEP